MNELKTLKEIYDESEDTAYYLIGEIRQEAIKWVKKLEWSRNNWDAQDRDDKNELMNIFDYQEDVAIDFIKIFFNITEEELENHSRECLSTTDEVATHAGSIPAPDTKTQIRRHGFESHTEDVTVSSEDKNTDQNWNLSEKIGVVIPTKDHGFVKALDAYNGKDVREFIKRLKDEINNELEIYEKIKDEDAIWFWRKVNEIIDKLAGEKLI